LKKKERNVNDYEKKQLENDCNSGTSKHLYGASYHQWISGSCFCGQLFATGQQRVDVRAGIGHLTEFHREKSFPGRESPFQYHAHLITFGPKKKDFEHM
jgi:hypothetical protein